MGRWVRVWMWVHMWARGCIIITCSSEYTISYQCVIVRCVLIQLNLCHLQTSENLQKWKMALTQANQLELASFACTCQHVLTFGFLDLSIKKAWLSSGYSLDRPPSIHVVQIITWCKLRPIDRPLTSLQAWRLCGDWINVAKAHGEHYWQRGCRWVA